MTTTQTEVIFRITKEYILEGVDICDRLSTIGHNLFLVLHLKPDNYHYHGFLNINFGIKTFRKRIKELLDPEKLSNIGKGGMRPFSVSDNINDLNRYKSYCLYRSGHPIQFIFVKENLVDLKKIHDAATTQQTKKNLQLKQERELKDILEIVEPNSSIRDILKAICKYYKETGKVVHKCKMQQLAHSVKLNQTDDFDWLVEDLINTDEALSNLRYDEERHAEYEKKIRWVPRNSPLEYEEPE